MVEANIAVGVFSPRLPLRKSPLKQAEFSDYAGNSLQSKR